MISSNLIESVSTRFVSVPLERPLKTATFNIPAIDTALVQVRTKDGNEGVGWAFAFGKGRVASIIRLIDDLGTMVIGRDALSTGLLWAKLSAAVGFVGRRGIAAAAISTIDTACWDIAGKAAGLPVYKLLGAHSSEVPAYASQGLWLDRSRDELAVEARALVEQGFRAVKMRAGMRDPNEDIARVRVVREAIGPDVKLMVDVNQGWDLKQTIRMARELEEFDLFWLEEPMPIQNVRDYAQATEHITMPMCTGESNYLKDELLTLLEHRATNYVMPDLMRMGGVTEWMKAAHLCESFDIKVSPHLFMEHSSHLAAACPNVVWQEFMPWWDPILANSVDVADGVIRLSDTPGFGIELDEAAIKSYELR